MLDAILLIGINYTGTSAALRGCHNDVDFTLRFLQEAMSADARRISGGGPGAAAPPQPWLRILKDDPKLPAAQQPTRANIVQALRDLARLRDATNIYIHFSGHGGTMPDMDGDEDDGLDSSLVPVDYERAGFIADDELRQLMSRFRPEQTVFFVGDCCHSGTLCDLPLRVETQASAAAAAKGRRADLRDFVVRQRPYPETAARVIMLSGCRDAQTSADAMLPTPVFSAAASPTRMRFGRAVAPSAVRRQLLLPGRAAGGAHALLPHSLYEHVSQHIRAARAGRVTSTTDAGAVAERKDGGAQAEAAAPPRRRVRVVVVVRRRRRRQPRLRASGSAATRRPIRRRAVPQGALTSALLQVLKDMDEEAAAARRHASPAQGGAALLPDGHWAGLLTRLHTLLQRRRFPQQPQLSFGRRADAHLFGSLQGALAAGSRA